MLLGAIFFILVTALLYAGHWLVLQTAIDAFSITNPSLISGFKWLALFLSLTFVLASLIAFKYFNPVARIFYTFAATWLGFAIYLILASVVYWLLAYSVFWRVQNTSILAAVLLLAAVATGVYGIIHAAKPEVTEITIQDSRLPQNWIGKRAVWVSDVHLGDVRNLNFANALAAKIQNINPDIVFVGGDYYDGVAVDADALAKPFAQIKTPLGVYFVTGNHEEFTNNQNYSDAIARQGITVLDNSHIDIQGLRLIGVDYRDSSNPQKYQQILASNVDRSKYNLLLKHVPSLMQIADAAGVQFQLSGHSHNGQIFPGQLFVRSIFKGYNYGLKQYNNLQVYTSSGVGTWGPPMRVGTKPEIVLINFK